MVDVPPLICTGGEAAKKLLVKRTGVVFFDEGFGSLSPNQIGGS